MELAGLIEPHAPTGKTGRPPFAVSTMLRIRLHSGHGSISLHRPWKKLCMTPRCAASLQGLTLPSPDCQRVHYPAVTPFAHHGPLQRTDQEHGANGRAVCFEQLVNGQKANSSKSAGISAPKVREDARHWPEKAENRGQCANICQNLMERKQTQRL